MKSQQNIIIVDYKMGNIHSVVSKLNKIGVRFKVSDSPQDIKDADKIILPGVGHFSAAMENIKELNLFDRLNEEVLIHKKPILGICLGMQLMTNFSEEGNAKGFGWMDAQIIKFKMDNSLLYKIPHVGWNDIKIKQHDNAIMKGICNNDEFYFVHSYYCQTSNKELVLTTTLYEKEFTSSISRDNIFGVQFHPEKSHQVGEKLIQNFINI